MDNREKNCEKLFKQLVNNRIYELTMNEDIQELFYSYFDNTYYNKIPKKSLLECVLLEPRIHKNIRNVLNNFTTIIPNASFTIFHSKNNEIYIKNIVGVKHNFTLKLLPDNFDINMYNKLLTSSQFWEQLHGEKILIFQVDTGIRRNDLLNFWTFSYIGAPWDWSISDIEEIYIGNGGLSLRDRKIMIKICNEFILQDNELEDQFFAKNILLLNDITYPTIEEGYLFSIEHKSEKILDANYNSMGFHQIIDKWERDFLITFFSQFQATKNELIIINNVWIEHNNGFSTKNDKLCELLNLCSNNSGLIIYENTFIPYINKLIDGFLKIKWTSKNKIFLKRILINNNIIQETVKLC